MIISDPFVLWFSMALWMVVMSAVGLVILEYAAEVWAHVEIEAEDYFFPLEPVINFCKMADQCQHDFVPICGQDSLGISRMFNDNCDLYEYNCDEKKQYRHVKLDVCKYEAAASYRNENR